MIGKRLAHYDIVEKLGEGGMGVVYKARDTRLDRFVALKVLSPDKVANADRKARFIQEAKAASALNHPNIVTVYDINSADGVDYMAMEFIPGRTLGELIPKHGLRLKEALNYAIQISDALSAAHAANIVHRDLKPANIMVNDRGLPKILDFGLAKLTSVEPSGPDEETRTQGALTEEGTILGSAPYMSPEQAQGQKLDYRSDIFSFGIVFYEMLSGQRPFQGESRMATMAAILEKEPASLAQVCEGIPREIERIVAQCLRKEIPRRAQSIAQIRLELEDLRDDTTSTKSQPLPAPKKRRWLWPAAAALLLFAVAAGAWRFLPRGSTEAQQTAGPLTSYLGMEATPSLSPDGNQVAFAWDGDKEGGPPQIYVSLIGRGSPLQLTKEGASHSPAWSPDGQTIAFLRVEGQGYSQVRLIPTLGGPEQQIGRMRISSLLSWSPDSKRIFFSARGEGTRKSSIFFLPSSGGEPQAVTSASKTDYPSDLTPVVSPDGKKLAFVREFADYNRALMVQDLNQQGVTTGQPRAVVQGPVLGGPAWSSDGRELFYIQSQSENNRIFRVDLNGGQSGPLKGAGEDAVQITIAAKRNRMVYATGFRDLNLYRQELPSSLASPAQPAVKILSSTRYEVSPIISPDGTKVAFSSSRGGGRQIWVGNADGSNPVAVTSFSKGVAGSPSWSWDSQWIAFDARPTGLSDVFVVRPDGSSLRQLTDHPAEDHVPCWSVDGKWIYFASLRSGIRQIYRMPASGGDAVPITKRGGFVPRVSPEGKWVYYFAEDGIWKAPSEGGQESQVVSGPLANSFSFFLNRRGLFYVSAYSQAEKGFPVRLLDLTNNKVTTVLALSKPPQLHISVSADGRYLYYSQNDRSDYDLMLVDLK
jgi:serine/threonine protein kinase